ncbi:MAG TPA: prolyl oligopeptidase family serine peptidase, partial [Longimicrobiales bacterium]|nr:prolyl oligopeptidase family serine peptidase [Longimicrobiales bacterium]
DHAGGVVMRHWLCALAAVALWTGAAAVSAQTFELTVSSIMRGPEHVGAAPGSVQWTDDGAWIHFRWKPGGRPWHEPAATYRVRAAGGEPERLSDAAADSVGVLLAAGSISEDGRQRVVSYGGDLYLIDRRTLAVRRLTDTRTAKSSPVFSRDARTVYYISDNNLFALSLADGSLRQVTDIRAGPAPAEPRAAQGQRAFLEEQQRQLFEHIRREIAQREQSQQRTREREQRDTRRTVQLARDERVGSLAIEPDGRYAVISTADTATTGARASSIPFWITQSGYTEPREVRTKVGDAQSQSGRMGIVSLQNGDVRWLDVARAHEPDTAAFGFTRFIGWNSQGTTGLIGAASADFKQAWLWSMDAATGRMQLVAHERNDAWVAGPCPFWSSNACAGWLPDGTGVYFVSERSGYAQLYAAHSDGSGLRRLTDGEFEVHNVALAPRKDRFYLTTNEGSPHELHFYHMALDGGNRVRITTMPGRQDATPAPDGATLAFVHSFANQPPELYVAPNQPGATPRRITTSPTAQWRSYRWIAPEIVHVTARDGVRVPARIYRPADVGAQPNGAAVIFVHGAGYLQNVHNWWSTYYREYMFHHLLAARGYVVLDIDYRGSAGYGRDWRTAIYRHMGGKDLTDQVDGSRYLQQNFNIDPERIGIYGGSYGGFITLMALFTAPEAFGAGAALRSVTDWAHYNHGYTGRILNLPQDDTLAYRRSSPIYFAEGLEDPLLIAHGMVDTNVHFSDVVRLAQRLIELGKTDWEMAIYPVEDHAFVQPTSWTDEYRRILELFDRHLARTQR